MNPGEPDVEQRVLLLAPAERGEVDVGAAGLAVVPCPDVAVLCREPDRGAGALLLGEDDLPAEQLDRLLDALRRQPTWSDVPLLVLARAGTGGGQRLEVEAGATLLARPVPPEVLQGALRAALARRRRQYAARDSLAQAAEQRDEFLSHAAHQLRNPLAAISNGVGVLRQLEARGEARVGRVADIIERQTRLLVRLVDDLFDATRATSGRIALERQPVELGALLARCLERVAATAQGRTIRFERGPAPLWIDGDVARLEQVARHLLQNAVQHTGPSGTIDLSLAQEGGEAVVRVRDDGIGIPAAQVPHLFAGLHKAPGTPGRAPGGLGVGLLLVDSLVRLHGGSVQAASEGPERGAELVVRLPLKTEAAPHPGPAGSGARRIVLIEDNADLSETLQELLVDMGHEVVTAADGPTGVARVLSFRPDVALVDIGLPGHDGYEVARQIRQALGPGILLVAMTGYGRPEDRRSAQDAGFDAHLTKPPKIDDLQRLLDGERP